MERCDFCSAMKIIREYISDERGLDQSEMLYRLFEGFFRSDDGEKLILDNGQVCRWLNGQAKLSPQIISYYLNAARHKELTDDMIADLCDLNRQIRADNKLLRELKSTLQKLTKAVEYSISRIAQALETLRDKIIVAEYQLIRNHRRTRDYQETRDKITPVLRDIHAVEQQIKVKSAERKNMLAEKKACGFLHPIRLHQLSGQIAALTEEIEELRDKKSMLLASLNCHSDSEAHNIKKRLEIVEQNLTKLTE